MTLSIITDSISNERDIVTARLRAHRLAMQLGIEPVDQTRIATAVSEVARNALVHGGGGRISFGIDDESAPPVFEIEISDAGAGIRDLEMLLGGRGAGHGLTSARRLVERFTIDSSAGKGTIVRLGKSLAMRLNGFSAAQMATLRHAAEAAESADLVHALQRQNGELLAALAEVRARQDELSHLNQELEDTNRGVMALYSELEEKAEHLRRASELKTRFFSNMSHEFRTPLSSILALTRLLADQVDGSLQPEQQKQVGYIRSSAAELLQVVNDLLDLAKVEAGRLIARPSEFQLADLFGGLRGVLKPLLTREAVSVVIEEAIDMPPLYTDEGKVAQILRNFIVNAFRFTKRGTVRVYGEYHSKKDFVELSVQDTGIGIAPQDREYIFQEFSQVDSPLQAETHGTGLGLPLSRRLAELLGGYISLESEVGVGSRFTLCLPRRLGGGSTQNERRADKSLLIIDDEDTFRYIVRTMVGGVPGMEITEAKSGVEGLSMARHLRPDAIILDVLMPGLSGQEVLRSIKRDPDLERTPVLVITSLPVTDRLRNELSGAVDVLAKDNLSKEALRQFVGTSLHIGWQP